MSYWNTLPFEIKCKIVHFCISATFNAHFSADWDSFYTSLWLVDLVDLVVPEMKEELTKQVIFRVRRLLQYMYPDEVIQEGEEKRIWHECWAKCPQPVELEQQMSLYELVLNSLKKRSYGAWLSYPEVSW